MAFVIIEDVDGHKLENSLVERTPGGAESRATRS
jgi:hypothetical protein